MRGARWFWRLLVDSAALLPRAVAALGLAVAGRRERAAARLGGTADAGGRPAATAVLLLPLGVLALLVALFATLNEVRVVLVYPLTDGSTVGPGTWGGPTVAGAWAVHAVLGILLFPVFVGVLAGLRALARLAVRRLVSREPAPAWAVPATVAADLAALAFLVAFVRQL